MSTLHEMALAVEQELYSEYVADETVPNVDLNEQMATQDAIAFGVK